jgi:hypothetical protein
VYEDAPWQRAAAHLMESGAADEHDQRQRGTTMRGKRGEEEMGAGAECARRRERVSATEAEGVVERDFGLIDGLLRYTAVEMLRILQCRGACNATSAQRQDGAVERVQVGEQYKQEQQEEEELVLDCEALGVGLLQFLATWETEVALSQVRSIRAKLRLEWGGMGSSRSRGQLPDSLVEAEAQRLEGFDVWMELGRLEVQLGCYVSKLEGRGGAGMALSMKVLAGLDWVLDDVLMSTLLASQRTCGDLRWPRLQASASERGTSARTRRGRGAWSQWGSEVPARLGSCMAERAAKEEDEERRDVVIGWPWASCNMTGR